MRCLTIVSQLQKRGKSTQIADDYSRLFQNLPVKFLPTTSPTILKLYC